MGVSYVFVDPTGLEPNEAALKRIQPVMEVRPTIVVGTPPSWAPKPDPLDLPPTDEVTKTGAQAPPIDAVGENEDDQGERARQITY